MIKLKPKMIIEELADALRVSRLTIYRHVSSGKIKGKKEVVAGKSRWVITKEQVINYLKGLQ
jgi:excisionase family DNA binding protein